VDTRASALVLSLPSRYACICILSVPHRKAKSIVLHDARCTASACTAMQQPAQAAQSQSHQSTPPPSVSQLFYCSPTTPMRFTDSCSEIRTSRGANWPWSFQSSQLFSGQPAFSSVLGFLPPVDIYRQSTGLNKLLLVLIQFVMRIECA
jgi:hypothetical protein